MVGGAVGFLLSVRGGDVLEEETWIAVTFPCRRKSVCVGQCVIRGHGLWSYVLEAAIVRY